MKIDSDLSRVSASDGLQYGLFFRSGTEIWVKIIKTLNDKRIAKYDELNMELILYRIFKDEEIKKVYLKKIGRLVEYDEKYNSNLIFTLQNYVRDQGNLALTARSLDIHRNTVKYRLKKAEELLSMNFSAPGMFLNLAILLKVIEIIYEKDKRDKGNRAG